MRAAIRVVLWRNPNEIDTRNMTIAELKTPGKKLYREFLKKGFGCNSDLCFHVGCREGSECHDLQGLFTPDQEAA